MTKVLVDRYGLRALVFAAAWLVALAIAAQSWAQPKIVIQSDESRHAGEFVVPINKSQVLQLDVPFADLLVGNSEIADVLALTDRSVYVLGKSLGSTSLTIYGRDKNLIAVMDLVVSPDIDGLKARLFELMPEESIEMRAANGSVIMSGGMSNASRLSAALAVAERYAPGLVTNLLTVSGSQQVMLKVRFAEVSRDVTKDLGFNFDLFEGAFSFASGIGIPGTAFGVASIIDSDIGHNIGLSAIVDALEQKGLSKTLAEPNLIALSGDTASFLAGGEFPIAVAQEGTAEGADPLVTVTFKKFGVSLAFTPTVLDDGLINLAVNPEVSLIEELIQLPGGGEAPRMATRRASTTIELRDGQSFAIAGLIQDDFIDTVSQIPLLGEIPVLGALFRSSSFQKSQTELVIIVEVHLVKPAPAGSLATPVDNFIPPSEADIWLFGRLEAPGSGTPHSGAAALNAKGAGGIDGHYGHIIK